MIGLAGVLLAVGLLAWANGANDVSKGIATLVGSGVTSYRRAMLWGAVWTGLGALAATMAARAMLTTFGSGLLGPDVTPTFPAAIAAIGAAAAWVLLATRTGLPVSTTHAIVGAVVGSGLAAYGAGGVGWSSLAGRVALPLAASPLAAAGLSYVVARSLAVARPLTAGSTDCVCVSAETEMTLVLTPAGAAAVPTAVAPGVTVRLSDTAHCEPARARTVRLTGDHLHWLSSGAVSFARGLNDAPKIVALSLGAAALGPTALPMTPSALFALTMAAMVGGSVVAGRRVTRLLAEDVTPMNHRDGLGANVVTAVLVASGAVYGLPMSTTHVASGSIVGVGVDRNTLDWRTVRTMALAWVVTLPAAALLGALLHVLATQVFE